MLTVGRAASHDLYYDKSDDYYRGDARAAARWFGQGAAELGLHGRINAVDSRAAFAGSKELFGRELGRTTGGTRPRLPGVDLTFSAPKSLSILALIAQDERLIGAHDQAVRATLAHVERSAAARIREGTVVRQERTGNLVVATWRHDTSRAQDPQLHTHAVVINATQTTDGVWRSLDTRQFFTATFAKEAGARYRAELAPRVRELGYRLETGSGCTFEIKGITRADRERFSRRTAQIDAALERRGIDPAKASPARIKVVVKDTRSAKVAIDRADLQRLWHDRAGDDILGRFIKLREQAEARVQAHERPAQLQAEPTVTKPHEIANGHGASMAGVDQVGPLRRRPLFMRRPDVTTQAVASAARHLGERDARFTHDALVRAASERAFGRATPMQIERAVEAAAHRGDLVARTTRAYDPAARVILDQQGWTTRQAIRIEQAMLARLRAGCSATTPIADTVEASRMVAAAEEASRALGQVWTGDQRDATRTLLTCRDRVIALQGLAGTAKTSTVLATYAEGARGKAFEVTPLAATGSAARTLGAALGADAGTVDRFLGRLAAGTAPASTGRRQVWMVDEASLLSARLTAKLLTAAEAQDARVVLVGDVKQLGSVEAGAAFRQLQEHGLLTARLQTIVRQTNEEAREAVYAAAGGDAVEALRRLEQGGGSITEAPVPKDRRTALADAYVQALLAATERHDNDVSAAFADVLAIDPSREGREALTDEIRGRLKEAGIITREEVSATTLERRDLTREEARDALRYRIGDVIRFGAAVSRHGIAAGEHLRVTAIDPIANTLVLERPRGGKLVWSPAARGSRAQVTTVFTARARKFAEGDRITLTRNDQRGWTNGTAAIALVVDSLARSVQLRLDDGRTHTLSLDRVQDQHWRHGYVETAHGAQGRTTGEVLAHTESWRVNLVTQESLYVLLSRGKRAAHLYTDSRDKLAEALATRTGQRATALEADHATERRPARERDGVLILGRIATRTVRQLRSLTERIAAALERIRGSAGARAEPAPLRRYARHAPAPTPALQAGRRKARLAQPVLERGR